MKNVRAVSAIVLGVIVTIYGTLALSGFVASSLVGETGMETYRLTALESLIRFAFYCVVGAVIASMAGHKRILVLATTGLLSVLVMVTYSHTWFDPEMDTTEKLTTYLLVYAPTFAILPAFLLVGYIFTKWQKLQKI